MHVAHKGIFLRWPPKKKKKGKKPLQSVNKVIIHHGFFVKSFVPPTATRWLYQPIINRSALPIPAHPPSCSIHRIFSPPQIPVHRLQADQFGGTQRFVLPPIALCRPDIVAEIR